MAGRKQYFT